jgi:P-type Cu+ transporter
MKMQQVQSSNISILQHCYHCGDECRDQQVSFRDHVFCCDGCKLVFEILDENNLCTYYAMGEGAGNSPSPDFYRDKFTYLDQPEIRDKLLHFSSATQCHVNFFVPGMHCSSCIWLLEHFRKLDPGVTNSMVNFPGRKVSIVYNPAETSLSAIASKMASIGYEPHISLEDLESSSARWIKRLKWAKIGVAGFCFGNIMMLSFPEYFSISGLEDQEQLRQTFTWLNLLLSLPVLLFSSRDFFSSALGAIRSRHLNIDLPVAAAILITFLRSVYELITGIGPGYFDSMSGIVFFMLIGRAFQDSTFETLAFDRDYKSYFPLAVSVCDENGEHPVQVSQLVKGMRIKIRNHEVIPADAVLLSPNASIDYSFVTGESKPEPATKGAMVYAGGRQQGTAIELEVIKPVEQSYLTRLWNNRAFRNEREEGEAESSLVNRINQYFTAAVFVLAMIAAIYWYWMAEPLRAWNAVTTILIVACPCILLLAATFTNGHVLRMLGRNGLYLKNARIIEKLGKVDTLVFDKTGTITPGRDGVPEYDGMLMDQFQQKAVAALVSQSNHPLSRRIAALFNHASEFVVNDFDELAGKGLRGRIEGSLFELGAASYTGAEQVDDTQTSVFLSIDGVRYGRFIFRNQIREGLGKQLSILAPSYQLFLLSGDHAGDKQWLGKWFKPQHMFFRHQPEDKLNFIHSLRQKGHKTLMIGDGLNDAGALRESDAGIAVSDDVNNFSPACDGILQGESMNKISALLDFSKLSRKVIGWSFTVSVIYNIIGLSFALRGELEPVIAAILMPTASISIVSLATLLTWLAARRLKLA